VSRPFLHSSKTVIQPQFSYATQIIYPKNRKDQIYFEYVKKYAATPNSDKHTGLYEVLLFSTQFGKLLLKGASHYCAHMATGSGSYQKVSSLLPRRRVDLDCAVVT
jgi:hypothetical protein